MHGLGDSTKQLMANLGVNVIVTVENHATTTTTKPMCPDAGYMPHQYESGYVTYNPVTCELCVDGSDVMH